jgi:hypothetical protein
MEWGEDGLRVLPDGARVAHIEPRRPLRLEVCCRRRAWEALANRGGKMARLTRSRNESVDDPMSMVPGHDKGCSWARVPCLGGSPRLRLRKRASAGVGRALAIPETAPGEAGGRPGARAEARACSAARMAKRPHPPLCGGWGLAFHVWARRDSNARPLAPEADGVSAGWRWSALVSSSSTLNAERRWNAPVRAHRFVSDLTLPNRWKRRSRHRSSRLSGVTPP